MSDDNQDAVPAAGSEGAAREDVGAAAVAEAEGRLEELADAIGRTIEAAPSAERESLHDYAVSLVRERLPVAFVDSPEEPSQSSAPSEGARSTSSSGGASLVGYGVLFVPVGFFLSLVFVPVGVMLLLAGFVMIGCGLIMGLVTRIVPRSKREER